jgi:photosystem II stability/assembly factor-like uncharacterized protein
MKKSTLHFAALTGIITLITIIQSRAQSDYWWQIKGIYGGTVYGISSKSPDYLFAGSMYEGMFRSTDNGINWLSCKEGLMNLNIMSTVCHPDGRILAGTESGLYSSSDNGNTWTLMGMEYDYVQALAVDSLGYIFAGTADGLYRSTNNGTTWDYIQYFNNASIWSMVVVPTNGYLFVGTYGRGVVRSTDHGETWDGNWLDFVFSLAADNQGNVYAGVSTGQIFEVAKDSLDWTVIKPEFISGGVWGLVVDENGFIFAGTNGEGIFRKSLAGTDWEQINTGLNHLNIISMGIGPTGSVFAGTIVDGVYIFRPSENRWDQAGIPVKEISSLLALSDGNILAGNSGFGVYKSSDLGYTWTLSGLELEYIGCMIQTPEGDIFAGTAISDSDGIFKSTDGGDTWIVSSNGLNTKEVRDFACDTSGTIYAGTTVSVFKSTDNGTNWLYGGLSGDIECLLYSSNNRLIAGKSTGLFVTDDEGATWVEKTSGLTSSYMLCITKTSNGHIFVGTGVDVGSDQGVYRSTDNGNTWTRVSNGLTDTDVRAIAVDAGNVLYAGTLNGGIYRSVNEGNTWTELNSGLTNQQIRALAHQKDGYMFAGTWGGSLFRNNHTETIPVVTTSGISDITSSTATGGGNVTADGGAMVTARGVCWSTAIYPTVDDAKTVDGNGTGIFTSNITGLLAGKTYHVRAYATNSESTSYGADIAFSSSPFGIEEITKTGLTIYPNPNKGRCQVVMDNGYTGEVKMELINLVGKVIKIWYCTKHTQLFNKQLELLDMNQGCYILRIFLDKEVINKSIIKL